MNPRLILASNSPRRQALLKECGFEFDVFVSDFEESFPDELQAGQVAEFLAIGKNKHYRTLKPEAVILTADTTVIRDAQVLNKPADRREAFEMLRSLSGRTHLVVCGVCISSPDELVAFSERTEVSFDKITPEEINFYIDTFQPFDKAGAYGIQEWIGMAKIREIRGSYYNVMGLPTHLVYKILKSNFGF